MARIKWGPKTARFYLLRVSHCQLDESSFTSKEEYIAYEMTIYGTTAVDKVNY